MREREGDRETCAEADLARDGDLSVIVIDNLTHRAQPNSCSTQLLFCGEQGLEDALKVFGLNS